MSTWAFKPYRSLNRYLFPDSSDAFPEQPRESITNIPLAYSNLTSSSSSSSKTESDNLLLIPDPESEATTSNPHLQEALKHVDLNTVYKLKLAQMRKASPLYNGPPARRGLAWLVLLGYLTLVYVVIFYVFYYATDGTLKVLALAKNNFADAYTGIGDMYQNLVDPATPKQVADIMGEFYELLAEMGYYDKSMIAYPPHVDPAINRTLAADLHFSQKAVEMMEMLPYLKDAGNESQFRWGYGGEFLLRGGFVDLREHWGLRGSRDPFLFGVDDGKSEDEDGGPYMSPDMVLLSSIGDEGTFMVLNVQNSTFTFSRSLKDANDVIVKMWTIEQFGGKADPATRDQDNFGAVGNWLSPEQYPSRLAREALRDYMNKFITLEWLPGGVYNGSWEGHEYARLYREKGWPGSFNVQSFEKARLQWHEDDERQQEAEEPFNEVRDLQRQVEMLLDSIARKKKDIFNLDAENDAGKDLLRSWGDSATKNRLDLGNQVEEQTARLPMVQKAFEEAREAVKSVDAVVRKTREERVAKYGF